MTALLGLRLSVVTLGEHMVPATNARPTRMVALPRRAAARLRLRGCRICHL